MGFRVVIPARYASVRLPGKPLMPIAGRPMIAHVIARALESATERVVVATDDARIAAAAQAFEAEVVMTGAHHRSGSDRLAEVLDLLGWPDDTLVVNLQGDEPCMPARLLDQVAAAMDSRGDAGIATLAYPIQDRKTLFDPNVVKVVTDREGYALYFSRAPVPWHRDSFPSTDEQLPADIPFLRHIGLYAYRAGFLRRYVSWPPAPVENAESLEQLRALWYGGRIHVSLAEVEPGPGVDTRDDLAKVERLLVQAL